MEEKFCSADSSWLPSWIDQDERWQGFAASYGYDEPRQWQVAALESVIARLSTPRRPWHLDPRGVMVAAVMGSGKTILIAELARSLVCPEHEVIVVTTSSQLLVRQNAEDLRSRVGPHAVGEYYAQRKEWNRQIIVTTNASAPTLAKILDESGLRCALWIADEAHRTECETILGPTLEALKPRMTVGLTATPYRSKYSEELSLFGHLAYHYTITQAVQDGVLCNFEVIPWVGPATPVNEAVIEMLMDASTGDPRLLGPGIVNAESIADAESFALTLREYGWSTAAVHSRQTQSQRDAIIDRLREGHLDIVVHVNLLVEGANFPWLRWLCLRRSTTTRVRFLQEVGRVLRTWPGKELALIFDPHGHFNTYALGLGAVLAGSLDDEEKAQGGSWTPDADDSDEQAVTEPVASAKWVQEREYVPAYLQSLRQVLEFHGIIKPFEASLKWRERQPSHAQLAAIKRRVHVLREMRDDIPERDLELLRCAYHRIFIDQESNAGFVSDFIGVLIAAERSKTWPMRLVDEKRRKSARVQAVQAFAQDLVEEFLTTYCYLFLCTGVDLCDDQPFTDDGMVRICWRLEMDSWFGKPPDSFCTSVVRAIDPKKIGDQMYRHKLFVSIGFDPAFQKIWKGFDLFDIGPTHELFMLRTALSQSECEAEEPA